MNAKIENNVFTANTNIGLSLFTTTYVGGGLLDVCVALNGNTSDNGFLLSQSGAWSSPVLSFPGPFPGGGIFRLEPATGNNVAPTTVGTITPVLAGTCN